jgi:predicted alpha/beta-fold hydrolase
LPFDSKRAFTGVSFPDFRPQPPWWGGDLQTVRNYLVGRVEDLSAFPLRRLELDLQDGTGDRLAAALNRPATGGRPLVALIHGLTGCESSRYMLRTAGHLLRAGYPVLRLNLRGAGPSRPLCRLQYHAGRSADLRAALAALPHAEAERGLILVGYSLGANMLLKLLGEGAPKRVLAAAAISAPIDLMAASLQLRRRRNYVYQRYILGGMKRESTAPIADISASERRTIFAARSVFEFDDTFAAPYNGFTDAAEYYARSSAIHYLDAIETPTLVIHALDDPWIPAAAYLEYDWGRNPHLLPLLPRRGGHVGFNGLVRGMQWHDLCLIRFLAAF